MSVFILENKDYRQSGQSKYGGSLCDASAGYMLFEDITIVSSNSINIKRF